MKLVQIQDLLERINGATFAGLDCVTKVKLTGGRRNPFQGKVEKHCKGLRVILFTNKRSSGYENMVRRRLEQEGKDPNSFVPGNLAWGVRLPDSPIIQHNDQHYLQTIYLADPTPEYYATDEISWYLDSGEKFVAFKKGDKIESSQLWGNIVQEGSGRQGLEDEHKVVVRTYALDSIKCIRLFKEQRCDAIEFEINEEEDNASKRNQSSDQRTEQVQAV